MKDNYNNFLNKFKYDKIIYLKNMGDYSYMSISDIITFSINCLVIPAILFQMVKTWSIRESKDFSPSFLLLQLFGGAPEGMIGLILGIIFKNSQMMAIGICAMIMRGFMFLMRLFGRGGLVKPLWNDKKKYIGFKK
jgi:hypothetical protein